jgi:hypothetical protein
MSLEVVVIKFGLELWCYKSTSLYWFWCKTTKKKDKYGLFKESTLETFLIFLFHFMNCCIFCVFLDIIGIEHKIGFLLCVFAWKMAITLNSNKLICSCLALCFVCAYVLFSCFCVLYFSLFFLCAYVIFCGNL